MGDVKSMKKGQKVTLRTNHGRTGSDKIHEIRSTPRGHWVVIETADGKTTTVRPSLVNAA